MTWTAGGRGRGVGIMTTNRLEAFSDGVLAIVITLLLLNRNLLLWTGLIPFPTAAGRS